MDAPIITVTYERRYPRRNLRAHRDFSIAGFRERSQIGTKLPLLVHRENENQRPRWLALAQSSALASDLVASD